MSDHTAQRGTEPAVRVSTLELFFDLVFVFTATQLTKYLADDISAERMLRVILMFGVIWWMYDGRFGRSASATFGLSLAYLLWWAYFSDDTAAEHAFADTPPQRRAMVAIYAFGYAHLVLLLGIVVIAAGVKKAIGALAALATVPVGMWLAGVQLVLLVAAMLGTLAAEAGRRATRVAA